MSRAILLVLDGLRRDFIDRWHTPHLARLRASGTWFDAHRSVFPAVTRVASASIATGCLPSRHGLAGNLVAMRDGAKLALFDVGQPGFIEQRRARTGHVLAVPTLAERLADAGGVCVFGNASPGAAYVHDPDGHGRVHHRAGSFGARRCALHGDDALAIGPGLDGDDALVDRVIAQTLTGPGPFPALTVAWLGHPDTTQHAQPLGSPAHREALRRADAHAGRLIDAVQRARAAGDDILLLAGSDHGHQTAAGVVDIDRALIDAGLKAGPQSSDVVVAPNGTAALIYVDDDEPRRLAHLAEFLRTRPWTGTLTGRDGFAAAGIAAEPDLAFALALAADDDALNAFGVPGTAFIALPGAGKPAHLGCGQHGGLGRYEQAPFLIADGPGFAAVTVAAPTSIVDIAPTLLRFLGHDAAGMDGRPLQPLARPRAASTCAP